MRFGEKYATTTQTRTMGASLPRTYAPLVKTGGDGGGNDQSGANGGGGNLPAGCPRCAPWWFIPLGALGVMQALAWILARR
jgi:hypothetical protein